MLQPLFVPWLHFGSRFSFPRSISCFMREVDGRSRLLVKNSAFVSPCTCSCTSLRTPNSQIYRQARELRWEPAYRSRILSGKMTTLQFAVCCFACGAVTEAYTLPLVILITVLRSYACWQGLPEFRFGSTGHAFLKWEIDKDTEKYSRNSHVFMQFVNLLPRLQMLDNRSYCTLSRFQHYTLFV